MRLLEKLGLYLSLIGCFSFSTGVIISFLSQVASNNFSQWVSFLAYGGLVEIGFGFALFFYGAVRGQNSKE